VRARIYAVTQILVGLDHVGVVGLDEARRKADLSGLAEREDLVDLMLALLAEDNYIHPKRVDAYRVALWREYLRRRGEDFSDFYSELPVAIRGGSDEERDRLGRMITSALAEHELRPSMTAVTAADEDLELVLEIDGEVVVRGLPTLNGLRKAVRHRLSDW